MTDTDKTPAAAAKKAAAAPAKKAAPAPAKKAASAPAKKAAAAEKDAAEKSPNNLYLPTLPEGFAYTFVEITGPSDRVIEMRPTADGGAEVVVKDGINSGKRPAKDMTEAGKMAKKSAEALLQIEQRQKEAERLRLEAFGS